MADDNTNPFDDAAQAVVQGQTANLRNNVYNAVTANPQQAAQHAQIASRLGIPVDSVAADPNTAKQQDAVQHFDAGKITNSYPHLAQFMGDQSNANQVTANGDVPNMANVEHAVKQAPTPVGASAPPALEAPKPTVGQTISSNLQSIPSLPYNAIQGLGGSFNRAEKGINIAFGGFPTLYDKAASLITGQPTTSASDFWFRHMVDSLDANAGAFDLGPNTTMLQKLTHGVGGLVGMLSQIGSTGGMGEVAPVAAAAPGAMSIMANAVTHATKSMAFPSITNAINTGNDVYQATGSTSAATKAAIGSYGTNTAMGVLPLGIEGNLLTRAVSGFPVGVLSGEANRQITNLTMPANMQQPATVEDGIINGLTGSILSSTMGANTPAHEKAIQDAYQQARQSYDAVQSGQAIQAISNAAQATQLRTNNPQAFKDFVKKVTDDGHLPEVYVDGQTFVNALHQSGVSMEELQQKMPEVASQVQEALHTNGDVRISTEDYATHLAGAKMDAELIPHMKTDPEGMTYQQGQEHLANQQAEMAAQAQEVTTKQQADDLREKQLKAIEDDRFQQLENLGRYSPSQNREMAQLHSRVFDAMSERMGLSPEEMAAKYPLRLTSDSFGEGLHQDPHSYVDDRVNNPTLTTDHSGGRNLHSSRWAMEVSVSRC